MLNKIIMPPGGQTTDELRIFRWLKHEGDRIGKGDILFEVETDKATLNVESFCEGILLRTCFSEGDTVETGIAVAYIGEEEDRALLPIVQNGMSGISGKTANGQCGIGENEAQISIPGLQSDPPITKTCIFPGTDDSLALASPAARKAAKEFHVDIGELGKSLGLKVVKVNHVLDTAMKPAVPESEYELILPTRMRAAIARRMTQSAAIPSFGAEIEVDMTECVRMRDRINEALKDQHIHVSFSDILMKGIAAAVGRTPAVNASWTNQGIKQYKRVHCGLAVAAEAGLVVPVVRDVQKISVARIAALNAENVEKARRFELSTEELSGGTITLSNLGMYGISRFMALINPPEACIVAAGAIQTRPVYENSEVKLRSLMNLTATFDHRVVDGAVGAAFLSNLRALLESPLLLLSV